MSLRDQLLAKGLVNKKQAKRAERELREERRQEKGEKKKRKTLQAEEDAAAEAARAAEIENRRIARQARETERERSERALQIRNTLLGNQIRGLGNQVFFHRDVDGRRLLRLEVSRAMADQLHAGDAAIAALNQGNRIDYIVIARQGADKLETLAPELVVFWARGPAEGPEDRPYRRDWESSLGPRRATPEDIARFRAALRATDS